MANRKLPFGYTLCDGQIIIDEKETATVIQIFEYYENGLSFLRIAEILNTQDTLYADSTREWNKNMIARILQDVRYIGGADYPAIIDKLTFEKAQTQRAKKCDTASTAIKIKSSIPVQCAECGTTLKISKQGKWYCSKCKQYVRDLMPSETESMAVKIAIYMKTHIEEIQVSKERTHNAEIQELLLQWDQCQYELNFDTEKAKSIAFRLAEVQLQAVSSKDYESKRIQYILENSEPNVVTVSEIAEAILLHNTGKVKLKLKNGQVYEGRKNICQN